MAPVQCRGFFAIVGVVVMHYSKNLVLQYHMLIHSLPMKIFEKIVAALFWLQIAIAPVLLSLFMAIILYANYPTPLGGAASIGVIVLGIIGGILLANWAAKKHGAIAFIARVSASPELDNPAD